MGAALQQGNAGGRAGEKQQGAEREGIKLFSKRVVNVRNDMPADTVDSTSLTSFKKSITPIDIRLLHA